MKTDEIEFFNVAEMRDGVLYRFPLSVCDSLQIPEFDAKGNFVQIYRGHRGAARSTYGAELRFVTDARSVTLHIESDDTVLVTAYNGDYEYNYLIAKPGKTEWKLPWSVGLDGVERKSEHRFSKRVWRIALEGNGNIRFCGIETEGGEPLRAPLAEELPRVRMLAYGSSISQGIGCLYPQLNYLNTAAQILGIDILNKAISGGCFCEPETVDYLCAQDFDAVYLEPGTNIADRPTEVVKERVGNLIDRFCTQFPKKTIFLMTPVRGLSDVSGTAADYRENFNRTRSVITEYAKKYANAVLLDGHKLLDKDYYLAADILHPSGFGHVQMGQNLAAMLAPYFAGKVGR